MTTSVSGAEGAAGLYVGRVMHARLKPVMHRFSYNVFYVLLDLARLDEADALTRVFSVNRRNILSFWERDHGAGDGHSLASHAERLLTEAGYRIDGGRTLLLCFPRVFGFAFNPLSIYYRVDASGRLAALIYEVRNTFGQRHAYVAPVAPVTDMMPALHTVRQDRAKLFYVSPFLGMDMRYKFRIEPLSERLRVRILESDAAGPILAAALSGARRPFTTSALLGAVIAMPFMTMKVVAAIHWEAMRLWLKGLRLVPRPAGPPAASYDTPNGPVYLRALPAGEESR